jgi:hypothetical protein
VSINNTTLTEGRRLLHILRPAPICYFGAPAKRHIGEVDLTAPANEDGPPGLPLPAASTDRLISLDILRGLALFGVMAINVVCEFRVSIFRQFLPALKTHDAGTTFFAGSLSPDMVMLL